tara:strand:- start:36 stop:200 length:165 start_codon:yes stop_codon:yes gene_type:complete
MEKKKIKGKLWKCRNCDEMLYAAPWGKVYSAFEEFGGRTVKGERWKSPIKCKER